ncbi:bifunctional 2-polyprenyl-6-hydroxyphenol methylase/3-demethylubiquinol 3-O-methyltransferase UbiG [Kutzneria sp. 744]|uniref:class I SAM-dependent methyltransferase n=1 Tax=Kutzneria sp. (strain 744) TaxID=345341 RepID=UPI0003EEA610|nr:class I SAM-dependent methyltransferase [Kutzneria sp. 744]EWM12536.1 hypothetical protein KUTG_02840 [Kutzneria sp. 744]
MRTLLSRLRRQPEPAAQPSILDEYVTSAPSAQNAVDVFAGEWSSQVPGVSAGPIPLFADDRVEWALDQLGGVTGASVLELGPLEGGHTHMLSRAGASSVLAIESQTRAYLKCLIAKELLGMPAARFVLGDFMAYLRDNADRFDLVFASGVLYHMRNPVETIALTARAGSRLFLWTHYYDEEIVRSSELLSPRFTTAETSSHEGLEHTLHRFEYESALQLKGFCGGSAPHSNWLSRNDLLAALAHFGWQVKAVSFDTADHPHGPALALVATKS